MKLAWPPPEVVRDGFDRPRFIRLRLDRFPRGADNFHIDVALGPAFGGAAADYIAAVVRESVQRLWKQPVPALSERVAENFREILQVHHRAVVKAARAINRLERVQLFQLSVIKLFLSLIDSEPSSLRLIGEELVRYNVNGIELEAAAYAQLNTEISLRRPSRRGEKPARFFAGSCTDVKGESHWLLVRERNVKLWLGGQLLDAEEEGRRYYEVISHSKLIGRVREKLSGEVLD